MPETVLKVKGPIPNPATSNGADFFFHIKESGSLKVNLYDARGRRLAAWDGGYFESNDSPSAQPHLWHWDPGSATEKTTAAGIYWLEFLIADSRQVHKVVLLP